MTDDERESEKPATGTVLSFAPKIPTKPPVKHLASVPVVVAEELIETAQMSLHLAVNLLRMVEKVVPVLREDGREVTVSSADGTQSMSFQEHAHEIGEVTIPHLEATLYFQRDIVFALQSATYTEEWYRERLREYHAQLPAGLRPSSREE